jgi:hypothetical protein
MQEKDYIVKEDMICPVTKAHCDDECCPVGSTCNMGNDEVMKVISSGDSFFSEEFKEKMEARRKQLNLKWEGWEENERDRQGGGILIVIAFIAGISAIAGTVIYILL